LSANLILTVLSGREELDRITESIEAFAEEEEWPPDLLFRINLVLEELVLNIMDYGHDDNEHEIEIALTSVADAVTINITDGGRAFDPLTDAPEPDTTGPIESRSIGGLGVHLAREMMDEMTYRRENGRNHLTLTSRRTA
jgi:serine/threonine-protein kinase RsbW